MNPKRSWLVLISVFISIFAGVIVAGFFIRGYKPDIKNKLLTGTGLLVANSIPKGASVFVNDKLVTATDDTVNLVPDTYKIKIVKDGFLPWEKTIEIKKEIVKQTEAHLFRNAPDLKPITLAGALNPTLSPDGLKVVYSVASASAQTKNGVWLNDLTTQPLNIARDQTRQLTNNSIYYDWSKAKFVWSPDSRQILAFFLNSKDEVDRAYLLPADRFTSVDQLRDISFNLLALVDQWQKEKDSLLEVKLKLLPKELWDPLTKSAVLITFSPNEEKFFYLATQSATIPENLISHPPARSDQPEQREIKPNNVYVYDLKEDTNFLIGEKDQLGVEAEKLKPGETLGEKLARLNYQPIYWLATNRHLIFVEENKIKVIEYDGSNEQVLFAGPFEDSCVYPWPDGNRLMILTSLYSNLPANLYALTIK